MGGIFLPRTCSFKLFFFKCKHLYCTLQFIDKFSVVKVLSDVLFFLFFFCFPPKVTLEAVTVTSEAGPTSKCSNKIFAIPLSVLLFLYLFLCKSTALFRNKNYDLNALFFLEDQKLLKHVWIRHFIAEGFWVTLENEVTVLTLFS